MDFEVCFRTFYKLLRCVMLFRGLMARGHACVAEFEGRLLQLLDCEDSDRALAAAASYCVLVNDDVQAVSAASSAVCTILWQQVTNRFGIAIIAIFLSFNSADSRSYSPHSVTSIPPLPPCCSCGQLVHVRAIAARFSGIAQRHFLRMS